MYTSLWKQQDHIWQDYICPFLEIMFQGIPLLNTFCAVLPRLLELYDKAPREFKDCIECLDYYT
jgi:hypothetical protein